ncbi:MAG: ABC transporter ATP-binding protein [Bacillota bacterium]|nr:ABC transporter ATP-binding protein [Bacillota bacterium]
MASITLKHIKKVFAGDVAVVKDFNLEIADKEFIVFVGPSGCGKTTVLRMIAGLEEPTEGDILIGGESVLNLPPKDRNISMVFQSYALFPHLTVYENIAFGLRARKTPKSEIEEKVRTASKILSISHLLDRKPKQLSGGERQRVAMGRAIVRNPNVFLMDEPLANLDALLRVEMRAELSLLHSRLQNTFIFVTHDQTEAMTLADRIVVMKDGVIQQVGTPKEIYNRPVNRFVAGFIGTPQMNFLRREIDGKLYDVGIRPEAIHVVGVGEQASEQSSETASDTASVQKFNTASEQAADEIRCVVEIVELLGQEIILYLKIEDENFKSETRSIVARANPDLSLCPGDIVRVRPDERKQIYFDVDTGNAVAVPKEEK